MKLLPLRLSSPASKKNRKHLKGGGGGCLGKGSRPWTHRLPPRPLASGKASCSGITNSKVGSKMSKAVQQRKGTEGVSASLR